MVESFQIQTWIIAKVSELLGIERTRLDSSTEFDDLGLDSICRAGLLIEIEKQFKRSLDQDALDEYPTIEMLSDYVAGE